MLRVIQNKSASGAKSYYSQADYLTESQELIGKWGGKGSALLGLSGTVDKERFDRLCDNQDPRTGEQLTLRNDKDRTVGYDFNFHSPKGVSVAYALNRDERIEGAFRESMHETMLQIEEDAATRVRKQGGDTNRHVDNLTWAEYIHKTARPVEGKADMHLHGHCFVMNAVYDNQENAWKAGQFRNLKRDAPFYEACFHTRLASRMQELGYTIERHDGSWDIAEVPKSVKEKFQRRTDQIEEKAHELGIDDPELKSELGSKTREKKVSGMPMSELRDEWRSRLTEDEANALARVKPEHLKPHAGKSRAVSELVAVEYAVLHSFERESVIRERQLLTTALRHGVGDVTLEGVERTLATHPVIRRELGGDRFVTTPEMLAEENKLKAFPMEGKGAVEPLNANWDIKRQWLNSDQQAAVKHTLESPDRVIGIQGGAGTGKTSLMSEVKDGIEAGGHKLYAFAPTAEASRVVLRQEGFEATTVAELLISKDRQAEVRGQVILIDEAGLLSNRDMGRVFDIANEQDARVILAGDWNQHSSPSRGTAFRFLEEQGAIKSVKVQKIERQKGELQFAVAAFRDGQTDRGFELLEKSGSIREISNADERYRQIADDYVSTIAEGKTVLAVAPTHVEGDQLNKMIRQELKAQKRIGAKDHEVMQLKPLRRSEAERSDATQWHQGEVLVFHQNAKGAKKGQRFRVGERLPKGAKNPEAFEMYSEGRVALSEGDWIRITAGGSTKDGEHRLNTGARYRIKEFNKRGDIVLTNGWQIDRDYGFVAPGYVSTSHSAQGKTVKRVLIAESCQSFPAAGREQMYVSTSRATDEAIVYTDNVAALKEAVKRSDRRISATDLMKESESVLLARKREARARTIAKEKESRKDYEVLYERS